MQHAPQTKLSLFILTTLLYLISPLLFGAWLYVGLQNGEFPVEADSIGLPFAGFMVVWFVAFPLVIVFCFAVEIFVRKMSDDGTSS